MKIFRVMVAFLAIGLVAAAVYLFFNTESLSQKLNDSKLNAEIMFLDWQKQNNCLENPEPCEVYSKQFAEWLSQFKRYIERKEQTPEFQFYFLLKSLDEQHVPNSNYGGTISLAAFSAVLLLLAFVFLVKTLATKRIIDEPAAEPVAKPKPKPKTKPAEPLVEPLHIPTGTKPDAQVLLRKASECAENEPMQAISYLEQAIEGSLAPKLSMQALLLCGSLRIKNKINEEQGKKQLQEVISNSSESIEAEKAQMVLNAFE